MAAHFGYPSFQFLTCQLSVAGYWLEKAGRASEGRSELAKGPVRKQWSAVEWLMDKLSLDLSLRFACVSQSSTTV